MAFTRKFLKALGIEDDKIDTIMEEHSTVTDGLKKERDGYKTDADKLPEVQKQLDDAKKAADGDGKDYKQLYTDLVEANKTEKARAGKLAGYKELLKSAKVSEKFWDLIIKANGADIDKIEMDEGKVKGSDELVKAMQKDLAAYISETNTDGNGGPATPPGGNGGSGKDLGEMSMEDYIAARKKM